MRAEVPLEWFFTEIIYIATETGTFFSQSQFYCSLSLQIQETPKQSIDIFEQHIYGKPDISWKGLTLFGKDFFSCGMSMARGGHLNVT